MTVMTCERARELAHDEQRGRASLGDARALHEHLQGCASCTAYDAQERVLSELLRERLPQRAAPRALKERLHASLLQSTDTSSSEPVVPIARIQRPKQRWLIAAAVAATFCVALVSWRPHEGASAEPAALVREAVNDHLRVLYAANPIEIESGGIHQVKPWFSGRIDFAPDVAFSGDDEFPMLGGAIGYVLDRKAATFIFKRRLHTISLLVFRAEQLLALDMPAVQTQTLRGFHVVMWQAQGLGHALVSDASIDELLRLKAKLGEP
jgi:anti-sigma factor RsiW